MRVYSALMLGGLVSMVLVGLLISASPTITPQITADVDIVPDVFNVMRMDADGGVITAYISNLVEDTVSYDVHDINVSTIRLYYEEDFIAEAFRASVEGDILVAKFDSTQVAGFLWVRIVAHMGSLPPYTDYTIELTVSGELINDGPQFSGNDIIEIIYP